MSGLRKVSTRWKSCVVLHVRDLGPGAVSCHRCISYLLDQLLPQQRNCTRIALPKCVIPVRTTESPNAIPRYAYLAACVRSETGSRFMSTLHMILWIKFLRYKEICIKTVLPAGFSISGLRSLAQAQPSANSPKRKIFSQPCLQQTNTMISI